MASINFALKRSTKSALLNLSPANRSSQRILTVCAIFYERIEDPLRLYLYTTEKCSISKMSHTMNDPRKAIFGDNTH